jgi:hypothetical protein
VSSAEVWEGLAVLDRAGWETEGTQKDGLGVRTSNTVHSVEEDLEGGSLRRVVQEVFHEREVKDLLKVFEVVGDRVDNLNFGRAEAGSPNLRDINLT